MKKTQKSGVRGQALVMVTLGLIAMCGLMGLAVDLGWSYFVEKQAQTAADAAALAAVQEANTRIGSAFGFTCPVAASGNQVYCQPVAALCSTVGGTSNLLNGCLYGQQNGFTDGGMNGRQKVTIQANCGPPGAGCVLPSTAPGVNDIAYWVTVRTTQTVPQLFSSVLGNTEGVVSASATAALVSSIVPGSFFALNQQGDCINTGGSGFQDLCGVDVDITGSQLNNKVCQNSGGASAALCAANGIMLSSTCHGASDAGCTDPGGGNSKGNWAGQTKGGANVWARMARVRSGGDVDNHNDWTPVPTSSGGGSLGDPFEGQTQPPLQVPGNGGVMQACEIPGGTITGTNGNAAPLQLGPYQYYATASGAPTGARITLDGNVQFSTGGGCPGTLVGSPIAQPSLPAYLFYGGVEVAGNTNFGPGQYVMVGNNSSANGGSPAQADASFLLSGGNQTIRGDLTTGTQFITTDTGYPGLDTQFANVPASLTNGSVPLKQGHIELKAGQSTDVQLLGIQKSNAPAELAPFDGSLFWQDRRNSTNRFNPDGTPLDRPCLNGCSTIPSELVANGVTSTSPGFVYDAAVQMDLRGTLYQARGAWFSFQGNADISSGLIIVTGMVHMTGGGQVALLPSANPIIAYVVALIH